MDIVVPKTPLFDGVNHVDTLHCNVAMVITLRAGSARPLTVADSPYAHAAILQAITDVDPAAGQKLHDRQRNKPLSLAIIEGERESAQLRLCFLGAEGSQYAQLLLNKLMQKGSLRLGRIVWDIIDVKIGSGEWSGISTWPDLMAPAQGHRLRFRFATPTSIAKHGRQNNRYFALFPDPVDVFTGLARRWQALEGPQLPTDLADFLQLGGCVVANYELRTVEFRTYERTQIGFVGRVVYECLNLSRPYVEALQALTRLAFFTGVGYQTARGMGLTHTSITD